MTYSLIAFLDTRTGQGGVTNQPLPQISGGTFVGDTLSVPAVYSSYQWNADGSPISGATSSTYVNTTGNIGDNISISVGLSIGGVVTSSSVGPILPNIGLIASGSNSAYFVASSPDNTAALWKDSSPNGFDATQATTINQMLLSTGFNDVPAYKCPQYADAYFNLPAGFSTDRRNSSGWAIIRPRRRALGGCETLFHFGPGLTDFFIAWSVPPAGRISNLQAWGTAQQNSVALGRTDLQCVVWSASASGLKVRVNGVETTFTALTAGTLVGGKIGRRQDGFPLTGELYEWAKIGRTLTTDEIASIEEYARALFGRDWTQTKQLVISGDSIGEGQASSTDVTGWGKLLDDAIGGTFIQRNQSASASFVQTIAATHASGFANSFDAALAKNIFMNQAGTNDLVGQTAASVQGFMTTLFTATKTAGFKNVGMTILPRADTNWVTTGSGRDLAIRNADRITVNNWLIAGGGGLLAACVDLTAIANLTDPNNTTYFNADKLHLADAAQPLISSAVASVVNAL